MKIALRCDSLLLHKALKLYLKEYLVDEKDAKFIVSDKFIQTSLPLFLVSNESKSDLMTPFTKEMLFDALERFYYGITIEDDEHKQIKLIVDELNKAKSAKIDKIVKKL